VVLSTINVAEPLFEIIPVRALCGVILAYLQFGRGYVDSRVSWLDSAIPLAPPPPPAPTPPSTEGAGASTDAAIPTDTGSVQRPSPYDYPVILLREPGGVARGGPVREGKHDSPASATPPHAAIKSSWQCQACLSHIGDTHLSCVWCASSFPVGMWPMHVPQSKSRDL
jgi:hypothetical protein